MIKRLKFEKYLHRPNAPTEEITGLPLAVKWESSQKPMVQHSHRFTELVIGLSGYGIHQGNGFRSEISRGDILVIPLGCTHNYQECSELSLVNILFDFNRLPIPFMDMNLLSGFSELFPDTGEFFRTPRPCPGFRLTEEQLRHLEPLLTEFNDEYKNFTPGRDYRMLSLFMVITGKIVSAYPLSQVQSGNELFPTLFVLVLLFLGFLFLAFCVYVICYRRNKKNQRTENHYQNVLSHQRVSNLPVECHTWFFEPGIQQSDNFTGYFKAYPDVAQYAQS